MHAAGCLLQQNEHFSSSQRAGGRAGAISFVCLLQHQLHQPRGRV
jgi:hypothetical protein